MAFFKKMISKKPLSVFDCGSDKLAFLIGAKDAGGSFQVLGAGESDLGGVENGEIRNLGDAVESVMDALRKAQNSAGVKVDSVYFNFDDPAMESRRVNGTKILSGEGEILATDIHEALRMAERDVSQFEKKVLYSKPVGFIVDDRDRIENPIGVFGQKLAVEVHILRACSDRCDAWQKLISRCHLARGILVPSALSTAYGILPPPDREKKRMIVDAGKDFFNLFIFSKNALVDCRVILTKMADLDSTAELFRSAAKDLAEKNTGVAEILFTGDLAGDENFFNDLFQGFGLPFQKAAPTGVARLTEPRYASLAGLFYVADELEKKTPFLQTGKGIFQSMKEKTMMTLQEYF